MNIWRKTLITNQLKENLFLYVNSVLLDAGYFRNVASGELDFEGNDLSKCVLDPTNSAFPSGQVWQSPRKNWVYEGDISIPTSGVAPNVPSGVYFNGVFKARGDATYGHYFDYKNGSVIFNNAQPRTSSIKSVYAFKEFALFLPNKKTLHNLYNDYFANDGVEDLTFPFNTTSTPAIHIEVADHDISPLGLGGGIVVQKAFHLHVVSSDDYLLEAENMADLLSYKKYNGFLSLDIDTLPERLDWRGDKASTYVDYKTLRNNMVYQGNKIFLLAMEPIFLSTQRENWNRIRIDGVAEMRDVSES